MLCSYEPSLLNESLCLKIQPSSLSSQSHDFNIHISAHVSQQLRHYQESASKQLFEVLFSQFCFGDDKLGEFVEDIVELDVVFVFCEGFIVAHVGSQLSLAVKQLVEVPQEQFEFAYVAALFVPADALDKYFVDALKPGDEVAIHVLDFGVLAQQPGQVGVGVKIVVVPHQVLSQEDAGIEPGSNFGVYLLSVGHEFLQLFREGYHAFGEGGQQFFDQVEVFVELAALDDDRLPFKVVEGDLEVDLLELLHEPLGLFMLVQLHLCATSIQIPKNHITATQNHITMHQGDKSAEAKQQYNTESLQEGQKGRNPLGFPVDRQPKVSLGSVVNKFKHQRVLYPLELGRQLRHLLPRDPHRWLVLQRRV